MVRGIVQHVSNIRGWGANRLKARWRSVTALLASEITIFNLFTRKKKFFLISFPPKFPPTTCKLANRAGGRIKTVHWLPSWFRQLATAAILGACFAWGLKKKKKKKGKILPRRHKEKRNDALSPKRGASSGRSGLVQAVILICMSFLRCLIMDRRCQSFTGGNNM